MSNYHRHMPPYIEPNFFSNWLKCACNFTHNIDVFNVFCSMDYAVCISDRIVVGDLLDDADHDLFRKVCHSHHPLNHLLPPKRIFTNL